MLDSRKQVLLGRIKGEVVYEGMDTPEDLEKTAKLGAFGKAEAWAMGSPFKHVGEAVKQVFVGSKSMHGPMAGMRKQFSGKMKQISPQEYRLLSNQKGPGVPRVRVDKKPDGSLVYEKEVYHRGGAVGVAQKYPLMTGLVGGGGYLLYKTRPPKQPKPPNPYLHHPQARGWGKAPGPQGPAPLSSGKWG